MTLSDSSRIHGVPESMYYIPNFISREEELYILQKINDGRWVQLSKRRLQPHPSALLSNNTLLAAPLSNWLSEPIVSRFAELGIFDGSKHGKPNHVLINEYQPGQGIMSHEDGPAYSPLVATVSFGAPIVLDVVEKSTGENVGESKTWRVLQEQRSLLVTKGDAYTSTLHGIQEQLLDENLNPHTVANWTMLGDQAIFTGGFYERKTRTSLTYRDVLKVSKAFGLLRGSK